MREDTRGVSEVLGYALVFALVISTVVIVTVAGLGELQATRNTEQINNAERAFDLLSTNIDDIARRGAPSRSTEIRLTESQLDIRDPIVISVETNGSTEANISVAPIIYRSSNSERRVIYSGGTIFRGREDGSEGIAVREPAIVAENDRLVLPIVQTRSRETQSIGGGTARLRASDAGTEMIVSDTTGTYDNVSFNVTSPRSTLWLDMLSGYSGFDDCGEVTGSADEIYCRMENPERLHLSVVRIDTELSS